MTLTLDSIRDIKLYQRERGYRFSMDALLLFDFVRLNSKKPARIADLGAGSGVIGLLLAKKYENARVCLIELQDGLFSLSLRNIGLNGLENRVIAIKADINCIDSIKSAMEGAQAVSAPPDVPAGFDIIVSNPPFRKAVSGRICQDKEKAAARHELTMSLLALVKAANYLVKDKGRFFMVYHPERLLEALDTLRAAGFEPKRLQFVHGREGLPAKMMLIEAVKGGRHGLAIEAPVFIYNADGGYTPRAGSIYEL